jgi:hypothetical protein
MIAAWISSSSGVGFGVGVALGKEVLVDGGTVADCWADGGTVALKGGGLLGWQAATKPETVSKRMVSMMEWRLFLISILCCNYFVTDLITVRW